MYNKITFSDRRIGQRWGATRAPFRVAEGRHRKGAVLFVVLLETQSDKPIFKFIAKRYNIEYFSGSEVAEEQEHNHGKL
ncbi:MAG: hypothetical protein K6C08_10435 [Oscillospiraceae bacterium]|nr:hypothetical protein [Oscillospiraceae bacterium]